ncbi:MAG: hypothetical protein V7K21_27325 [Nostoc sp.]|uniref:hypothetical protein n=1 Tax=Nostoc sp. TaxID=1180 RepID=UPI002FF45429
MVRYKSSNTPYSYKGFIAIALAVIGSKISYLIQRHTDGYNNRCFYAINIYVQIPDFSKKSGI